MTTILILLNIFLLVYTAFFVIVFLAGILRGKKEFPETAEHTRFAVLIPARNEEKVIGKLLTSLAKMDYPRECCTVCVIADRCTDRTVEAPRRSRRNTANGRTQIFSSTTKKIRRL